MDARSSGSEAACSQWELKHWVMVELNPTQRLLLSGLHGSSPKCWPRSSLKWTVGLLQARLAVGRMQRKCPWRGTSWFPSSFAYFLSFAQKKLLVFMCLLLQPDAFLFFWPIALSSIVCLQLCHFWLPPQRHEWQSCDWPPQRTRSSPSSWHLLSSQKFPKKAFSPMSLPLSRQWFLMI